MPHLNKTSSLMVNEQFKAKHYKMVGDKPRKKSTEDKVSISRENIKIPVSRSISSANFRNLPQYMMRKIKADPPSPKLLNQSVRQGVTASMSTLPGGLARSDAERNLNNQSTISSSAGRPK